MDHASSPSRPPLWLRLLRAVGSYLLASLVAGVAFLLIFLVIAQLDSGDHFSLSTNDIAGAVVFIVFASVYVAAFAALPAMAAVLLIRALRWPRGWSDTIAGGLVGGVLAHLLISGFRPAAPEPLTVVFAAVGAIGGLTYWLAAGRPAARERVVA
ncbi:hypothetical protein L5876_11015 [Hyphobacterium sp. SN044]|uniref:hypothetical protein n=1 Tax=Hyphobacterium sp. SN044 TaxID=2912575 RepID=UPI001F391D31|nr:hypothetical protein [Hyphobacterium sp. SN044]MCF8880346.1 hypothetical protein [Hyphobacterium sp. SN044]